MKFKSTIAALAVSFGMSGAVLADTTFTPTQNPSVSVYGIHDRNTAQNGVRGEFALGEVYRITPTVSYTYVHDQYSRFALGGNLNLVRVGNMNFDLTAAGVYQHSNGGYSNGYGLTAGLQAGVALTDSVTFVGGVERFMGQSRVNNFDGNLVYAGLRIQF